MKDYKELIDPQLWWLANGGDEQAMYELSERGPAHWLPARPNPEKGPEYWKLLKDSARIFARVGARPPKGYFANPDMEADLHAEIDKFARLNGRKRGMGSTVAFYHTRGGRSEVESDARMAWRAQAAAASDEADARLREEQAERDLRATLKQAGFTPIQITTAIRAHRARVAENKAKKNPVRNGRYGQEYGGKIWPDDGYVWEVRQHCWKQGETRDGPTTRETVYVAALPLADAEGDQIIWRKSRPEGRRQDEYIDGAGNRWLITAHQVSEGRRGGL